MRFIMPTASQESYRPTGRRIWATDLGIGASSHRWRKLGLEDHSGGIDDGQRRRGADESSVELTVAPLVEGDEKSRLDAELAHVLAQVQIEVAGSRVAATLEKLEHAVHQGEPHHMRAHDAGSRSKRVE